MSDPLLSVRDLHVQFSSYEGVARVIDGVDLSIGEGKTAALVGETGCGKSVTAKTILGLLPEAEVPRGEISFDGVDLLDLSERERQDHRARKMSLIMQDPMTSLNPVYTVGEQMLDVLKWRGRRRVGVTNWLRNKFRDHEQLRERAIDMLERVQISAPGRVFSSYPVELSGGMRQRVLIAIALLTEPELLVADEPTTALDVTTQTRILELLDDLIEETGTSVLYITHNIGVARQISDTINVMYAGNIVERAPTEQLFDAPQHPYTRGLLDSVPRLASKMGAGIDGQIPDYTGPPDGCRFAPRCPHGEAECWEFDPHPRRTATDHHVACHLYEGAAAADRHRIPREAYIGPPPWAQNLLEGDDE